MSIQPASSTLTKSIPLESQWRFNMKLTDTSLPVLVLQMDHYGALGVVRSLGRLGVQVYGAHPTHRPVTAFSRYCRKVFPLDINSVPAEESVCRLHEIA